MKIEVYLINNRVDKVIIFSKSEIEYFTHIINAYAEERGFRINDECYLTKENCNVNLFLPNYYKYYNDNDEMDIFINLKYSEFKKRLKILLEEIEEKIIGFSMKTIIEVDLKELALEKE